MAFPPLTLTALLTTPPLKTKTPARVPGTVASPKAFRLICMEFLLHEEHRGVQGDSDLGQGCFCLIYWIVAWDFKMFEND